MIISCFYFDVFVLEFMLLNNSYDGRAKAMEVDERPTESYSDIGGLDKQITVFTLSRLYNSFNSFFTRFLSLSFFFFLFLMSINIKTN